MSLSTSELRVRLGRHETGLTLQYFFTDHSMAVLLLCIVISVLFCYSAFVRVLLLTPCGHLLGKGWPLGSRLWSLIVKMSLSHWYPGSGVVLDCIDSWILPYFLLFFRLAFGEYNKCDRKRSRVQYSFIIWPFKYDFIAFKVFFIEKWHCCKRRHISCFRWKYYVTCGLTLFMTWHYPLNNSNVIW